MKIQKQQSDVTNYLDGLYVSKADLLKDLEAKNIHGDFRADGSFIGFDYSNQIWIDTK